MGVALRHIQAGASTPVPYAPVWLALERDQPPGAMRRRTPQPLQSVTEEGEGEGFSLVARSRDGRGSSATMTHTYQGSDDHDG
jgi:hypothetical protein